MTELREVTSPVPVPVRLLAVEPPSPRVALRIEEAASALGVSRDHFDRYVRPELRLVRLGRVQLVAVAELERWLDRAAARPLEGGR